ncbi:MAG: hypothetical protein F9K23_00850 [Bacteroidetes bacterium]|nr:MAG: hypothetical protein F9K23_00850 [Bacteroidota bacterium]
MGNSKAKQYGEDIRGQVLAMLGITAEEYFELVFASGVAYAEANSFCHLIAQLKTHSALYWAWWENQFAIADDVFLHSYQYAGKNEGLLRFLRTEWKKAHLPEKIKAFPPNEVLKTKEVEYA